MGLVVFVSLLARKATAQVQVDDKRPLEKRIECVVSVTETKWRKFDDTLIHVRVKNRTDKMFETKFNATLYLNPEAKLQRAPLWSPVDLTHDAPAPIDNEQFGGGAGAAIKLKMQSLRIGSRGEVEFTIHAANMKWQREISSAWPDLTLMTAASPGDYSLKLTLDTTEGSAESNTIAVAIVKQ